MYIRDVGNKDLKNNVLIQIAELDPTISSLLPVFDSQNVLSPGLQKMYMYMTDYALEDLKCMQDKTMHFKTKLSLYSFRSTQFGLP